MKIQAETNNPDMYGSEYRRGYQHEPDKYPDRVLYYFVLQYSYFCIKGF